LPFSAVVRLLHSHRAFGIGLPLASGRASLPTLSDAGVAQW
jgi:hypothetical protein